MDDSMKQFCIQPHPTYLHIKDMYRVELNCFMLSSLASHPRFGIPTSCYAFECFFLILL